MPYRFEEPPSSHGALLVEDPAGRYQCHQHWQDMASEEKAVAPFSI